MISAKRRSISTVEWCIMHFRCIEASPRSTNEYELATSAPTSTVHDSTWSVHPASESTVWDLQRSTDLQSETCAPATSPVNLPDPETPCDQLCGVCKATTNHLQLEMACHCVNRSTATDSLRNFSHQESKVPGTVEDRLDADKGREAGLIAHELLTATGSSESNQIALKCNTPTPVGATMSATHLVSNGPARLPAIQRPSKSCGSFPSARVIPPNPPSPGESPLQQGLPQKDVIFHSCKTSARSKCRTVTKASGLPVTVAHSRWFEWGTLGLIVLNTVSLAAVHHNMPDWLTTTVGTWRS